MAKRPQMSREPAFQMTAALVHFLCACFNIGAAIYHARRVRGEDE